MEFSAAAACGSAQSSQSGAEATTQKVDPDGEWTGVGRVLLDRSDDDDPADDRGWSPRRSLTKALGNVGALPLSGGKPLGKRRAPIARSGVAEM